jgi:hypothetical protein
MLRLLGSPKRLCDGLTRRDLLHVGGLSALGLTASELLALQHARAKEGGASNGNDPTFGKAKSCILLFLFGSPPQHETFDPKPNAPAEIRGEMKAIASSVPGIDICEGLPQTAQVIDRLTVVRSMTHPYPVHGVAYALTGMAEYTPEIEARPRDLRHWPFLGSLVDYADARGARPDGVARPESSKDVVRSGNTDTPVEDSGRATQDRRATQSHPTLPRNIALPWLMGSKCDLAPLAGPYAAFLGEKHDPVWTDFEGDGTAVVPKLSDGQTKDVRDPFGGVVAEGRFRLAGAAPLEGLSQERFDARRVLLSQFDKARAELDAQPAPRVYGEQRAAALSLLESATIRDALDIGLEGAAVRERFGMTLFGQSSLAARRLVEAGGRFVSVFWDPFALFGGSVWDTHANHFPRLKEYLLPVFDQTFSALILDLEQRGLLDETLVLVMSEHGRTPQIDSKPKGAGRHHWSRAYSMALAGGGIARGRVVGKSDAIGGDVVETPISPKDILATALHLLGIDPHAIMHDRLGRPLPLVGEGRVRRELLA